MEQSLSPTSLAGRVEIAAGVSNHGIGTAAVYRIHAR